MRAALAEEFGGIGSVRLGERMPCVVLDPAGDELELLHGRMPDYRMGSGLVSREVAADFPDLGRLVVEKDQGLQAALRPGQEFCGRALHAGDRLVEEEPEQ